MPKFGRKSREHLETCHADLQTLFNAVNFEYFFIFYLFFSKIEEKKIKI